MIKIPKKIKVKNLVFDVIVDKTSGGGSVDFHDNTIRVGTSDCKNDPNYIIEILIHELSEAAHVIQRTRYSDTSVVGNFKFFMDHKEFESHNAVLSDCIVQILQHNKLL